MRVLRAAGQKTDSPSGRREISAEALACAHFLYDYMLRLCSDTWYRRQTRIGYDETYSALIVLKGMRQYVFLNNASDAELRRVLRELHRDFNAFYAGRAPYPRPSRSTSEAPEDGYPVVSRCHDCGYFMSPIPQDYEWTCPDCGVVHLTRENAELNACALAKARAANIIKLPP